jgi:nucleoside 2-deoxyribosyltransferase
MRIFLSIKFHEDMHNREFVEAVINVLQSAGHEVVCVVCDLEEWGTITFKNQVLMARTFELIESCSMMVVEQTEKGTGLGIEAGYAVAKGIPVVTIAQQGVELSPTLEGISTRTGFYRQVEEIPGLLF